MDKVEILLMSTNTRHPVERVGVFTPKAENKEYLGPGEIGFIVTGIKDLSDTKISIPFLITPSSILTNITTPK